MKSLLLVGVGLLAAAAVAAPLLVDSSPERAETPLKVPFKRLGTIRPRPASEIKSSNWTVGCEGLDRDFDDFAKFRDYLEPLGIKTIRLQAGWAKTERTKGVLDFAWLDEIIDYAVGHGLNVLLELGYGNPAYGEGGGGKLLGAAYPTSDEALAAWDRWVDAITTRYKGKVRDYAMWNEPDIGVRYTPKGRRKLSKEEIHTPAQIAAQNVRTARIVKRNIPDARLAALSLACNDAAFLEACLAAMGEDVKLFTWVIYHGYCFNPDASYAEVEKQKAVARRYGLTLRQGENGCPSGWVATSALSQYPWSEYSQAKWDMRRMLGDLGHDIESSVFTMMGGGENKSLTRRAKDKSVIDLKLAYYAVQNVASVFDDAFRRVPSGTSLATNDQTLAVYEYRRVENGAALYAFWDHGDLRQFHPSRNKMAPTDSFETRPVAFTFYNRALEDPVWVDLMSGQIYEFPKKFILRRDERSLICKMVPVYDSPCLLAERRALADRAAWR